MICNYLYLTDVRKTARCYPEKSMNQIMRTIRIHQKKDIRARLRENLVMMVICLFVMLWAIAVA